MKDRWMRIWTPLWTLTMVAASLYYLAERRWGYGAYFAGLAVVNGWFTWKGWKRGHRQRREDDQRRASGGSSFAFGPGAINAFGPGSLTPTPSYAGEGPRVASLDVPDSAVPITAWRSWRIDWENDVPVLVSPTRECRWPAGEKLSASCTVSETLGRAVVQMGFDLCELEHHSASPESLCLCGVYGLKNPEGALEYRGAVFGEVKLWGKVIEGTEGYRAQFAYPSRLWIKLPKEPELPTLDAFSKEFMEKIGLVYDAYCTRLHEQWEDTVGERVAIAARLSESYGVPCVPLFPDEKKVWLESVSV